MQMYDVLCELHNGCRLARSMRCFLFKQDHCEIPSGCLRSFSLGAAAQGVQARMCFMSLYMDPIKEVKTVSKQCVRCWKVELLPHTVSWDFVFTDICVSVSLAPGKDGIFRFISPSLAPHHFLLSFWLTWLPWSQRNSWNTYCDFWDILLLLEVCLTLYPAKNDEYLVSLKRYSPPTSLSAAGDTKAPGFNLAHLHSREQKREKKTRCVFIPHSSKQKNRLRFICYIITLIRCALGKYFIW